MDVLEEGGMYKGVEGKRETVSRYKKEGKPESDRGREM